MQLHSDEGLTEYWFLGEVEVLLLAAVHKLRVLALSFQDLLHILHVYPLVLSIVLLLLSERALVEFALLLRLQLIHPHAAVLDWFGHDALTVILQLSQFLVVLDRGLPLISLDCRAADGGDVLLVGVELYLRGKLSQRVQALINEGNVDFLEDEARMDILKSAIPQELHYLLDLG